MGLSAALLCLPRPCPSAVPSTSTSTDAGACQTCPTLTPCPTSHLAPRTSPPPATPVLLACRLPAMGGGLGLAWHDLLAQLQLACVVVLALQLQLQHKVLIGKVAGVNAPEVVNLVNENIFDIPEEE